MGLLKQREREREIGKWKAKEFGRAKSESRRKIWDCVGVGGPKCWGWLVLNKREWDGTVWRCTVEGEYGSGGGVAPTKRRGGGLPRDDDVCDWIVTLHQCFGRCFSFPKIFIYLCRALSVETIVTCFFFPQIIWREFWKFNGWITYFL